MSTENVISPIYTDLACDQLIPKMIRLGAVYGNAEQVE